MAGEFGAAAYSSVGSVIERTKAMIAKDRLFRHLVEEWKKEINMSQEQNCPLYSLGTAANLTSDAHLAALAIERGARLYSTDNDFSRFPNLRWTNPID